MRKLTLLAALLLLLAAARPTEAQNESRPPSCGQRALPLDSCVAWAWESQTAMKNALLDVDAAKETRRAALAKYFPSASLMAGCFHAYNPLIDKTFYNDDEQVKVKATFDGHTMEEQLGDLQGVLDQLGVEVNLKQLVQNFVDRFSVEAQVQMLQYGTFANAIATQPVYAGGRIVNGNKLAELGVQAAELRVVMTRDEVELNVATLYCQIVSLREKQKTLQAAMRLLDTIERDAAAAVEGGLMSRNDLLKARLRQNDLKATATRLTNGIELSTMALCQYIGRPFEGTDYLLDSLGSDGVLPPEAWTDPKEAAARRAESHLLDLEVEAARLQRKMTLGESLPQAALGATYGANNLLGDQFKHNGMLFASLNVPLTAWWENSHKVRKERIAQQQSENNRQDLREKMVLQTRQAQNEMLEAYSLIAVCSEAVDNARENYTEVRNYFDAGMTTMKDLLEAQALLQQALNDRTDQLIEYRLKTIRYRQLTR